MANSKKQLSEELLLMAYRLREARAKKFKTVKGAADAVSVQRTLWSHWENAFVRPQDATLKKLADVLDVPVGFFRRKPENWETEKRKLLAKLIDRTRTKRAYYNSLKLTARKAGDDIPVPQEEAKATKARITKTKPVRKMKVAKVKPARTARAPRTTDTLDVFFQMTGLIADAQNKVANGEINRETYRTHMRMIADMVKISLFTAK